MNFDLNDKRHVLWKQLLAQVNAENYIQGLTIWDEIYHLERFWSFPGAEILDLIYQHLNNGHKQLASNLIEQVIKRIEAPTRRRYRLYGGYIEELKADANHPTNSDDQEQLIHEKPCFEVLVMHPDPENYFTLYYNSLINLQSERDEFYYDIIFVTNLADAALALVTNERIQACVTLPDCGDKSNFASSNKWLQELYNLDKLGAVASHKDSALKLQALCGFLRPQIETFYISLTDLSTLPSIYFDAFSNVFSHFNPFKELHYHILNGVRQKFNTPFYNALRLYGKSAKTVFHALPISQGASVKSSVWLQDFYSYYGKGTFNAESSGTQRGLDSLLNPTGAIKSAQDKAARAFGAKQSFFVTNGTSTSNKIVLQANLTPKDIVIVSSDCHKSIPYGVVLAGANCLFIQTNPVEAHDLYGASPLVDIKEKMFELKKTGQLHLLKMIVLTNSTFDGLTYNVEKYMMDILAIKADLIFHWDEAWFAFSHFHPLYHRRHGTTVASKLEKRFKSEEYRSLYQTSKNKDGLPDPDKVKVRVYTTHSTHKTLSSFRQGSMIHVHDQCFNYDQFADAYYTHTSTSPNYQILASLDIARRQVAIEGFSLIQKCIKLALELRSRISQDKRLNKVFQVLDTKELTSVHKASSISDLDVNDLILLYNRADFMVDPTRITLNISKSGLSGGQFRKLLINRYSIQVNKTSRNTVLFLITIATTSQDIHNLFNALSEIVDLVAEQKIGENEGRKSLPMPQNRRYAAKYSPFEGHDIVNMRKAYYDAYESLYIDFVQINETTIKRASKGEQWVSASFVTPYPPGFPLLVPGQVIDYEILIYLSSILNDEIHGYDKQFGLKIFNEKGLCNEK